MSKYLEFNFPATRFVRENTTGKQIHHVLSEADEVRRAMSEGEIVDRIMEEVADLTHSLETFWRLMVKDFGEEYVDAIFDRVEAKNRERGYYEVTE